MKKEWTSERIRKELAEASKSIFVRKPRRVETEKNSIKKISIKRAIAYTALALGLSTTTIVAVDQSMLEYNGSVRAIICWECGNNENDGIYKSPKDAIRAINPNANPKEIVQAEKEFIYLNNLPSGLDYRIHLKEGEYEIPVIK